MDAVLHFLYHLPAPSRPRTQPMQVLALGMPRSGTESLRRALLTLGFDHTWHGFDQFSNPSDFEILYWLGRRKWDGASDGDCRITAQDFDKIFGHAVAVTDIQSAAFARDLVEAYPDAKVILNYRRDEEAWYKSVVTTLDRGFAFWMSRFAILFCAEAFWAKRATTGYIYNGVFRGRIRKNALWARREHHAMIRGLVPSEKLLEWCVEDSWEPLCKFLDRPVPKEEFPSGNTTPEIFATIVRVNGKWKVTMKRNMSILAAAVLGLFAVIWKLLGRTTTKNMI